MESTSKRGHIQLSKDTAELLVAAGKSDWIKPRESLVNAKGKGTLETYWLRATLARKDDATSVASASQIVHDEPEYVKLGTGSEDKLERLISWNTESLLGLIRQILAHQKACVTSVNGYKTPINISDQGRAPLNEVKEIIQLPEVDQRSSFTVDPSEIQVAEQVEVELRDYVACVASMYRDNPFHNFEHASHVHMSVSVQSEVVGIEMPGRLIVSHLLEGDQIVDTNRGSISS